MHEILNSFTKNSSQNFNNHSSILKNPKNFKKPQNMKCMKNERLEAYQVKKLLRKLGIPLGKRLGVSERGLGGEKVEVSRERSR